MKPIAFVLLVLTLNFSGYSQNSKVITRQNLVWVGYFNTLQFSKRTFLTSEIQERFFVAPMAQHQFVTRTHFHYTLTDGWDGALAMTLFLQNSNDPTISGINVPELRPHIEFNQKQKLKRISIDHRYKVEARFYQNTNPDRSELETGYTFSNFRFRYRLHVTIPFLKIKENQFLKLKLSDEIHINAGQNVVLTTFDQNRIYAALNIDLCPSVSAEIGYLNWFQKRPSGADYYGRNILRFTLYHKINLIKKSNG